MAISIGRKRKRLRKKERKRNPSVIAAKTVRRRKLWKGYDKGKFTVKLAGKNISVPVKKNDNVLAGVFAVGERVFVARQEKDGLYLYRWPEKPMAEPAGEVSQDFAHREIEPGLRRKGLGEQLWDYAEQRHANGTPTKINLVTAKLSTARFLLKNGFRMKQPPSHVEKAVRSGTEENMQGDAAFVKTVKPRFPERTWEKNFVIMVRGNDGKIKYKLIPKHMFPLETVKKK